MRAVRLLSMLSLVQVQAQVLYGTAMAARTLPRQRALSECSRLPHTCRNRNSSPDVRCKHASLVRGQNRRIAEAWPQSSRTAWASKHRVPWVEAEYELRVVRPSSGTSWVPHQQGAVAHLYVQAVLPIAQLVQLQLELKHTRGLPGLLQLVGVGAASLHHVDVARAPLGSSGHSLLWQSRRPLHSAVAVSVCACCSDWTPAAP